MSPAQRRPNPIPSNMEKLRNRHKLWFEDETIEFGIKRLIKSDKASASSSKDASTQPDSAPAAAAQSEAFTKWLELPSEIQSTIIEMHVAELLPPETRPDDLTYDNHEAADPTYPDFAKLIKDLTRISHSFNASLAFTLRRLQQTYAKASREQCQQLMTLNNAGRDVREQNRFCSYLRRRRSLLKQAQSISQSRRNAGTTEWTRPPTVAAATASKKGKEEATPQILDLDWKNYVPEQHIEGWIYPEACSTKKDRREAKRLMVLEARGAGFRW